MTTITQIAEHAGVSIATVSRVVNGTGYASAETKRKVQAAIAALDYRPNTIASSMRRQESRIIGVLQTDHRTFFNSTFADSVEAHLFKRGYVTIVSNTMGRHSQLEQRVDYLLGMRVAGLLVRPGAHVDQVPDLARRLRKMGVASVFVETFPNHPDQFHVQINNQVGAGLALQHLIELGHRQIGVLAPIDTGQENSSHAHRLQEIKRLAREYSQDIHLEVVQDGGSSRFEFGRSETRKLLRRRPQLSALIGLTDQIAVGAMHGVRDLGLSVPEDISIVGYDDSDVARSVHPRLTTVHQPVEALGASAAAMLIDQFEDTQLPARALVLSPRLIVRQSSAAR